MTVIKFGKWDVHSTDKFRYDRIRLRGYIWTPLCKRVERKIGWEFLGSRPMSEKQTYTAEDIFLKLWDKYADKNILEVKIEEAEK